jgi:hypothetical protein
VKDLERRLTDLEKRLAAIEKTIDNNRLLKQNKGVMTVSEMARKGGKATGKKGLAAMSPERRAEIQAKALETRRKNRGAK